MRFGKIRIEDGNFIFAKRMMVNMLPCEDILWAYAIQDTPGKAFGRQFLTCYLVIHTAWGKKYQFDMSEQEAQSCILFLRTLNPNMAAGFPQGERIRLQSMTNTRDLGGIANMDGLHIVPGRLIRSGDLYHLSIDDQRILQEDYHLKRVIDFRSRKEIRERPDTVMAGVEYYHIPVLDEEMEETIHTGSLMEALIYSHEDAEERLQDIYETIITDDYCVRQYARFLDLLINRPNGAVLWHSSMGKDRAGIAAVLLLTVLRVSRKVIREDFARSNQYLENEMRYMRDYLRELPFDSYNMEKRLPIVYRVEESAINRLFTAIDRKYGSMQGFLKKGLLLGTKDMEKLRELYLM